MGKKIIAVLIAAILVIAISVFIYRYQILQYTAETLIRKYLPNYIKIDKISFDFSKGNILLGGIKVLNPAGFSREYLAEIEKITCRYKMQGNRFIIKDGKVIFSDSMAGANVSAVTFEDINAEFTLKMDEYYTKILAVSSAGVGYINGNKDQVVKWVVGLNPTTPRLTMSNRFEVSNVPIVPFKPYYDKYSPLAFKAGKFSGLLIFDFDNGNIGSDDEIRLKDINFFVKEGYENAEFLETTVPDLVKYFTSPYGEIIFDFKIKGDMSAPKFFLGPKSKAAIVSMAIDKISAAVQKSAGSGGSGPQNDVDKAKQYIDLFKGLIKK